MKEIKIEKLIIRVDENKPNGQMADLIMIGEDGVEYQTKYSVYANNEYLTVEQEIIGTAQQ